METYILPTLRRYKPDFEIIHAGCNAVKSRKFLSEQIARGIIQLGNISKDHQVKSIFISSLVGRNSAHLNQKIE